MVYKRVKTRLLILLQLEQILESSGQWGLLESVRHSTAPMILFQQACLLWRYNRNDQNSGSSRSTLSFDSLGSVVVVGPKMSWNSVVWVELP